jgi:transketolase
VLDGNTAPLFDPTVWVLAGDGCLEEGVSGEASSLAGTLGLDNLVLLWDDNRITIDGPTSISFDEDVRSRYRSYGWRVLEVDNVEDLALVEHVLREAELRTGVPTLVAVRSMIGYPAPHRAGTSAAHAGAFGDQEAALTKEALGFPSDASLVDLVDRGVLAHTRLALRRGSRLRDTWEAALIKRDQTRPDLAKARAELSDTSAHVSEALAAIEALPPAGDAATRVANGEVIAAIHGLLPLWGGSADVAGSTSVAFPGSLFNRENPHGDQVAFGIREHAMAAFLSGVALHGTWRPYGSTYLTFSDYVRPALRLASLMELPIVLIFTHDSVAVGEDGPTHQPVEQIAGLRTVPGVSVVRPADTAETRAAWKRLVSQPEGPVTMILSRQQLPALASPGDAARGGYVAHTVGSGADLALIATGSEVHLAIQAADALAAEGVGVRVVSMPCLEWFEAEGEDYREQVLPAAMRARVTIEAGVGAGWWKYAGTSGQVVSVETFGVSGSSARVMEHVGLTVDHVISAAKTTLEANTR